MNWGALIPTGLIGTGVLFAAGTLYMLFRGLGSSSNETVGTSADEEPANQGNPDFDTDGIPSVNGQPQLTPSYTSQGSDFKMKPFKPGDTSFHWTHQKHVPTPPLHPVAPSPPSALTGYLPQRQITL